MFRLIKWTVILALIVFLYYLFIFFKSMNESEISEIKKDAIIALDSGNADAFTGPLTNKMKDDLERRKASFFEDLRREIKKAVHSLFKDNDS
ncbi:MAG TPA: hypothetical protein VEL47_00990 [Myxococcota bacterium]|nr:hypothetical protein [Myxococcota bacterium]